NLEFRVGSVEAVPLEDCHVLDAVVCFETIEHVWEEQQLRFLGEVERLLKPEGVLVISTPNKLLFSDKLNYKNEFHRKEFYYGEYVSLLKKFFRTVYVLGQKVYPTSYMWQLSGAERSITEHQLIRSEGQFGPVNSDKKEALFLIAVCTNGEVEVPGGSVLLDISERATRGRQEELNTRDQVLAAASAELASRGQAAAAAPEQEVLLRAIGELRQAFEERARDDAAQQHNEGRQREVAGVERYAQSLSKENETLQNSVAG